MGGLTAVFGVELRFDLGDLFSEGGDFIAGGCVEKLRAPAGDALAGFGAFCKFSGQQRPRLL